MKNTLKVLIVMTFLFAQACANPCQEICVDMQSFAKDCGTPFTNEEMTECLQNQGKKTKEEKDYCAEARPQLEEKWTCDNLEVFFD